ncbi:MAG TPA: hypothetical protein VJ754_00335, partial [Anaerolineae bacterium]|nr:hypothetical protein [Anaerolineae bacterium]
MNRLSTRRSRLIVLGLLALAIALVPAPATLAAPADRRFRIEARSFEYSPPILEVQAGDRVTIELVSTDVVHGLYLDDYGLSVESDPGQT